jgi:hypothetical protein
MNLIRLTCVLAFLFLTAAPAVADRVVLRNGRELTGKIVSENAQEIVIDIGDGMKMTLRRAVIRSIEKTADKPEPAPEPAPEPKPEAGPAPQAPTEPPKKPSRGGRGVPDFFGQSPAEAWRATFGRYPEIYAAKLTRFRAYDLAERSPLRTEATDDRVEMAVRKHGHGGTLARWKFRYVGNLELHYGDRVKFVGEITAPARSDPPLISCDGGPVPTARRVVILLVKRPLGIERYATTTTFTNRDFRTASLKELERKVVPVRTFDFDYGFFGTVWVTQEKARILRDLVSPFGESPQSRILRYRFRVDWFRTPAGERPGLDPVLLQQNAVQPLAKEGTKPATADYVAKMWGSEETARKLLEREIKAIREQLAALGITPGHAYYVEQDRIGLLGEKGVTIETFRARLGKRTLEDLLRP